LIIHQLPITTYQSQERRTTVARTFDAPIITTDQNIDRVLAAGLPIGFVFLEGDPPPPLEQAMKHLAKDNAGKLLVVRIPVKDGQAAARRYQVSQFPALVTVCDGQTLTKAEAIAAPDLEKHVAFLLGQGPRPQPARHSANHSTSTAAGSRPYAVTDATFDQEVLRSSLPVLVDFWAPWCGPCRMVEPILEKLAPELAGRLRVVKLNVDENPATAQRYGVQSIPTMLVVKNGQIAGRWTGALPEAALRSRLTPFLAK
jgi:thioredoxin 1